MLFTVPPTQLVMTTFLMMIVTLLFAGSPSISAQPSVNYASDVSTLNYYIDYPSQQNYYRLYLDTQQGSNGLSIGGIRASFLVENGALFSYTGTGTSWSWSYRGAVTFTVTGATTRQWRINRSVLGDSAGCHSAYRYIGQVGDAPTSTALWVHQPLARASNCPSTGTTPPPTAAATAVASANSNSRRLAVVSYIDPYRRLSEWDTIGNINSMGIAIINPYNGPGYNLDSRYLTIRNNLRNKGVRVIGYVYTSNGARDASLIRQDIDRHYSFYQVDGIFLDESWVGNCDLYSYYQGLYQHVKSKGNNGTVVMNPGSVIPECYINAADVIMNAETYYSHYVNWKPSGWETKYSASRFWHVVHTLPQDQISNFSNRLKANHAGYVWATGLTMPDPYNMLPATDYLNSMAWSVANSS